MIRVLFAALLAGALVVESPGSTGTEVPFRLVDQRVFVDVRVDGRGPYSFILDSGANGIAVDRDVARQVGLRAVEGGAMRGGGADAVSFETASGTTLTIGDVDLTAAVVVLPLDSILAPYLGRPVHGVLGGTLFRERAVELDFATGVVRLRPSGSYTPEGGLRLPIEVRADRPFVETTLEFPGLAPIRARTLVDLGAKLTLHVARPFVERHELETRLRPTLFASVGAGIGGETRYHIVRMRRLEVGGLVVEEPVAGLSDEASLVSTAFDAVLGTPFFQRFERVVFDYPRGHVLLAGFREHVREEFDMSGMFLIHGSGPPGGYVTVERVVPGSAADRAGIVPGDRLLSVEGRPAVAIGLTRLREMLRGGAGTALELEVATAGVRRRVTLRLRRQV